MVSDRVHAVGEKMEEGNGRVTWNRASAWEPGRVRWGGQGKCSRSWHLSWRSQISIKLMDALVCFQSTLNPNVSTSFRFIALVHYFQIFEVFSFWQGFPVNSSILIWRLKGSLGRFIFISDSSLLPLSQCVDVSCTNKLPLKRAHCWCLHFSLGVCGFPACGGE